LARITGLVGKANVGKSTFFAAATMKPVDIGGFPFTTIQANKGVAYVRTPCVCRELGVQDNPVNSACIDGIRLVPVDMIDCPGLIRGAHQGRGLGNQFLDEVRRADALIVVCDAAGATDDNGQPVPPGTHDPIEDVRMLESEFDLWLLGIIKKDWEKINRTAQSAREDIGRHLEAKLTGLGIDRFQITSAAERVELDAYKSIMWSDDDLVRFVTELRRASKPLIVAANKADKEQAEENVKRIREAGYQVVPTCAEAELALRRAASAGLISYTPGDDDFEILKTASLTSGQHRGLEMIRSRCLERLGSTGLQEVINAAFFTLLENIVAYPVENAESFTDHQGRVLPDCYLVPKGTTARQFAGLIHTELGESFIFAVDARTKMRLGEDYTLNNNDVIQIVAAKGRR
jgi:ribosome-binding ATPase YchF (GTP1/OBG family)